MTTLPGRVIGAKPAAFARWIFQLLGAAPGDTFDDLFPGSGAIGRAWHAYTTDPSDPAGRDVSCSPAHPTDHLPTHKAPCHGAGS